MRLRTTRVVGLVTALAVFSGCAQETRPWPTSGWDQSTPGAQDLDAAVLDELDAEFASGEHGYVDGMVVARNGYLVYEREYEHDYDQLFERYDQTRGQNNDYDPDWHPFYHRSPLHTMQSLSKNVTSALIGIASGRGDLPGLDTLAMPYFDDYDPIDDDPRRDKITLRHLLTMTSGIAWDETLPYTDPRNSSAGLQRSEDWIRYVLDQPMRANPGEEFNYNGGGIVMLEHILLQTTGEHADTYAMRHLFAPLGIENVYWKKSPTGLVDIMGGLYLTPRDMLKFAYLYINDGVWEDERILPEGWVAMTTEPVLQVPGTAFGYGHTWWTLPYEGGTQNRPYIGRGYGDQRLLVIPEYDLIALFTGWNVYDKPDLNEKFVLDGVLRAVH